MNLSPSDHAPTLHVVSLEPDALTAELLSTEELPDYHLEDIGAGLPWGLDSTQNFAVSLKKECWLVDPATGLVLYRVSPSDITLH